jgi:hypothetical protein
VRKGLVGIGHPMRVLPPFTEPTRATAVPPRRDLTVVALRITVSVLHSFELVPRLLAASRSSPESRSSIVFSHCARYAKFFFDPGLGEGLTPSMAHAMHQPLPQRPWSKRRKRRDRYGKAF